MKIGYFTSIEGWGGSEMYLLRLMQGVRECGHEVLLFGVAGTRLWEEVGRVGIERVAWRSIQTADRKSQTADLGGVDCRRLTVFLGGDDGAGNASTSIRGQFGQENSLPSTAHRPLLTGLRSAVKSLALASVPSGIKLLAGNIREMLHLRQLFKAHPVEVMHVNVHGYEVAGIACRLTGIPSVGVYCISVVDEKQLVYRLITKLSGKAYTMIVGKSRFCLDGWMRRLKISSDRGVVVYNGVDISALQQRDQASTCARHKFRFVSTGRLHSMKGYDLLVEAFSKANLPDAELVIAGEGSMRQELQALRAKYNLRNRFFLPGHVEDIVGFLLGGDVFVLPSVSHESFGQSVIEAMALSLPVVTSDYGPFPELNIDGETGFLVPVGDVQALAEKLKQLYLNATLRKRFGNAARARAEQCFDHETCIAKTIRVYQQVLDKTRIPIHE